MSNDTAGRTADLVLEGGGVKGIGLAGAVTHLAAAGYRFARVAGTSAGAITGAVIAALEQTGEPVSRLAEIARRVDYGKFRDRGRFGEWLGPLGLVTDVPSLLLENGMYEGDYIQQWLAEVLDGLGVRTFGDLRLPPDPESDLPESHRYRLVVVASDLSRQRALRLPWDYPDYGLDPDEQSVAEAVRMSSAIPFFFEPVPLRAADGGVSTVVDGGVLTNFPITIFDRTDGVPPRWPTFGVRLSLPPPEQRRPAEPVGGPLRLALSLLDALYGSWDAMHVADPCVVARTIFAETEGVNAVDFNLSERAQHELFTAGQGAAERFLTDWNFSDYLARCRG